MPKGFIESISAYLPMIVLMVVCVAVMIIPQKRKDKKFKQMLDGLKVGDRVKTIGCIYGKVIRIKDDLVSIETGSEKTVIEFSKDAIAAVENGAVSKDTK
ncbi:MAG: preprotein translocase subunit YajC [Clostridia bacterium]|nr:preprotein translocase subunit YajC [Clostridia bacterium]